MLCLSYGRKPTQDILGTGLVMLRSIPEVAYLDRGSSKGFLKEEAGEPAEAETQEKGAQRRAPTVPPDPGHLGPVLSPQSCLGRGKESGMGNLGR